MPVSEYTRYEAWCDECDWYSEDFDTPLKAEQALDEHIRTDCNDE
jgi:hypothetical protein